MPFAGVSRSHTPLSMYTFFDCFYYNFEQSRSELELQNIEVASTSDAVSFITYVQSLKRNLKIWESQVRIFFSSEF